MSYSKTPVMRTIVCSLRHCIGHFVSNVRPYVNYVPHYSNTEHNYNNLWNDKIIILNGWYQPNYTLELTFLVNVVRVMISYRICVNSRTNVGLVLVIVIIRVLTIKYNNK